MTIASNTYDFLNSPVSWQTSQQLVAYPDALDRMERRVADIRDGRAGEQIWLLEHPPLYTAGTSANVSDLKDPGKFPVYDAGRGGQYTYHGPGQRVGYVMLDLRRRGKDVRRFIWHLEQVMINAIAPFGVSAERRTGRVGVWVVRPDGQEEKIAAIGVRVRQWVTFHGLAINVNPDLSHFSGIVPCGISGHGVTSLAALGTGASMKDLDISLKKSFEAIFGLKAGPMPPLSESVSSDPAPENNASAGKDPIAQAHESFV